MTYFALLTAVGEAKLANAIALGEDVSYTHMAVGDGGGSATVPTRTQTALVNERRRAGINEIRPDPLNPAQIIVEQVIPESVGGWWIREIGVFDDEGDLVAVANCPDSYKPLLAEGSGRTQIIRMVLLVSSAASVQLKIDPTVVLATRAYADAGDAAVAAFASAHATRTDNPHATTKTQVGLGSVENYPVATQAEAQTGTANNRYMTPQRVAQAIATLAPAAPVSSVAGRTGAVTLTKSDVGLGNVENYPVATQAEAQAGTASDRYMTPQRVADAISTRAVPVGTVIHVAGSAAPTGFIKANGAAVSRATYAALFAAIGTLYGAGDGSTTFNVPDLRGEFVRGWDDGRGIDSGRALGSAQASANLSHTHTGTASSSGAHTHTISNVISPDTGSSTSSAGPGSGGGSGGSFSTSSSGAHTHSLTVDASGGGESRPRSIALLACIKF